MGGAMPGQGLTEAGRQTLETVWGDQSGWVFTPRLVRPGQWVEGPALRWPEDRERVFQRVSECPIGVEQYWGCAVYREPERRDWAALPPTAIWADMDDADPHDAGIPPTIAWETSPSRYQAVWVLDQPTPGVAAPGGVAQRLSRHLGADPGGWDVTQVLRVPDQWHHKGRPVQGHHLWTDTEAVYTAAEIAAALPPAPEPAAPAPTQTTAATRVPPLPKWLREEIDRDGAPDRSAHLWHVAARMAELGYTEEQIAAAVASSPAAEKYSGRPDQLAATIAKAVEAGAGGTPTDGPEDGGLLPLMGLGPLSAKARPVKWLVEGVWQAGACGWISGEPKSYKSWLGLEAAIAVASGGYWLGEHKCVQAPVLTIQAEDSADMVWSRAAMILAGVAPAYHPHGRATYERGRIRYQPPKDLPLSVWSRPDGLLLDTPEGRRLLRRAIRQSGAELVCVDTMGLLLSDLELNDYGQTTQRLLRPLRQLAAEEGCSLLLLHHARKPSQTRLRGGIRMAGSAALHGWADAGIYLDRRDDGTVGVEIETKAGPGRSGHFKIPDLSKMVWAPVFEED